VQSLKEIFIFLVVILSNLLSHSQCTVSISSSSNPIVCGSSVNLFASGISGNQVMNNDFDLGNAGTGWNVTTAATFTNPCGGGNGTTYLWMGDQSPAPRSLSTVGFDLSCGGEVCFDLKFAVQSDPSPCEGPDQPTEGVDLMYSIDNGLTWVSIFYFEPDMNGNLNAAYPNAGDYTAWTNYCFQIPPAAQTANTMIGWFQNASTSLIYDHWGLDNITIQAFDCNYYYVWSHNGSGVQAQTVSPPSDSTFTVLYTNGINDSCWASIPISVVFPDVTIDPVDSLFCSGDTLLNATLINLPVDSCCYTLEMFDSYGDGWNGGYLTVFANLTSLGQFSASLFGTTEQICFANGDQIRLVYSSGAFEYENTYNFLDPNMNLLLSQGPTPTVGTSYVGIANCPVTTYSYQWTPANLVLSPNTLQTQTTTLNQGTYNFTITVTSTTNPNCFSTDTITIVVGGSINTIGIFHN